MAHRTLLPSRFVALAAFGFGTFVWGCGSKPPPNPPPTNNASDTTVAETPKTAPSDAEPAKPAPPTPVVKYAGFATPESVVYDEARDRYLVSNINGKPVDADNNGFISDLSPDGKVTNLKWIEGGKNKVTLNAPKGLAIVKDLLYVADLDTVRMFDLKTGAPKGAIKLPGATFANDVAASDDGKVYVSDSGLKMEGSDFKPTGTDAVWVIEKGKAKPWAKSADLERPNGLLVDGKSVLVAPFGASEVYRLDEKGKKADATAVPKGSLDGIVKAGDDLLVSSWDAQTIFKGKLGATFEPFLAQLKAPADIGLDKKRNRVLVPRFMDDAVEVYDLGGAGAAAPAAPATSDAKADTKSDAKGDAKGGGKGDAKPK
jgi:sugar lactone lactonase YvrE